MDFEHFSLARDFSYLAALFLGAGFGCILNRFRIRASSRFRNLTITAGFCFFSGTVVAFTAAVIFSNWLILKETALYMPLGILTAVLIIAFRFPRAAGFPIFIISGVLAIAVSFSCSSFPAMDKTNQVLITRDGNGVIYIRPLINRGNNVSSPEADTDIAISFQTSGENSIMEFRARCLAFTGCFPLVGGVNRGVIAEVLGESKLIYTDPRPGWKIFSGLYPQPDTVDKVPDFLKQFVSFWEIREKLDVKEIHPGMGMTVLFDGYTLTFH